jgi:large subunit ribosomal protein L1
MSKKMAAARAKIDATKSYSLAEAVALAKSTSTAKFDGSIEIHVRLGIDVKKSDQQIRSTVSLPHGSGKTKIIAAFVGPNDEKEAKEAGADFVYGEADIKDIKTSGKIAFEVAVATPEMMPKLAIAAQVMGPKGLMPNPKNGTVDKDVKKMIAELKGGKVAFKNDETGNIHVGVGKVSFDEAKLIENAAAFIEVLQKLKPQAMKGTYIKTVHVCSTMGPSIKATV